MMLKTLERLGPLFTHGGGLFHKSKGETKRKDIGKEEGDVKDPERSRSFLHSQVSVDGRSQAKRQRVKEILGGGQCEILFISAWKVGQLRTEVCTNHMMS